MGLGLITLRHNVEIDARRAKHRIASCLILLSTVACGNRTAIQVSTAAVSRFHEEFNEQKFDEIYQNLHPDYKAKFAEYRVLDFFKKTFSATGKSISTTLVAHEVEHTLGASRLTVYLTYDTTFQNTHLKEVFIIYVDGGLARIVDYQFYPII